jgi:high-affinity K+ transport system ATPase subunit B
LAKLGVLPTRLSAVDEAGTTDVLCADKTGTLTQNALTVTTVRPMPGFDEAHVLALAALASSDGGQDPVDGAIRAAAAGKMVSDAPKLAKFMPFDPAKKMSEASATDSTGATLRIVKGAFAAIIGLAQKSPTASTAAKELEGQGFRVMAVAAGPPTALRLAGLIALSDPPRADSAALITELRTLGVRTVANRQPDDRWRRPRRVLPGLRQRRPVRRQVRDAPRRRRTPNPRVHHPRVRQPGDALRDSRAPASLELWCPARSRPRSSSVSSRMR